MTLTPGSAWDQFRSQMPVVGRWAYFDHAAVAPISGPAHDAIAAWLAEAVEDGGPAWPRWDRRIQQVRAAAAALVGAAPEEIGLVRSTTDGVTLVAEGFPWQSGDNVVIPTDEFPTNQYPWLNLGSRGVETRRVPVEGGRLDLDRLAAACNERTRIVALSWVSYLGGWRTDPNAAAEMAHRRGALLLVDAIQGLGAFPLDVSTTPIDFFAADGHKWMLGPEGAALLYVRRQHLAMLRPLGVGWNSVVHDRDYSHIELRLKESAARYEGGSANSAGLIGLGASLDLLAAIGVESIGRRILEVTDECCRRLREAGATIVTPRDNPQHNSGIVSFELPGCDSLALKRYCASRHVALSCRGGRLRISPHAYANNDDIGRLITALLEGKKAGASSN